MKYNDRATGKTIVRKSNNYLKMSLTIFVLSISVLFFAVYFYIGYTADNNENYMDNQIVHIIQLDGFFSNEQYRDIEPQDKKAVQEILKNNGISGNVSFFFSYLGAYENETDESVKIVSTDSNGEKYIFDNMEDNICYSSDFDSDEIDLVIPEKTIDKDGNILVSDDINIKYPLQRTKEEKVISYFWTSFDELKEVFVSENTFLTILQECNYVSKDETNLYNEELNDRLIVEDAYVYIDSIYDVEDAAKEMEDAGFDINYTFSAFDHMGNSLKKNGTMFLLLILLLLCVSAINVFLSVGSYLRIQQKDMGILKFFGYSDSRIINIYKRNIKNIFFTIWSIISIISLFFELVELGYTRIYVFVIGVFALFILLFVLYELIITIYLKKMIKKNVLYLIKEAKEFE